MHCQWHGAYCWTRRCSSFAVSPCATGTAQRSRNQIAYVFQSGRQAGAIGILAHQTRVSSAPRTCGILKIAVRVLRFEFEGLHPCLGLAREPPGASAAACLAPCHAPAGAHSGLTPRTPRRVRGMQTSATSCAYRSSSSSTARSPPCSWRYASRPLSLSSTRARTRAHARRPEAARMREGAGLEGAGPRAPRRATHTGDHLRVPALHELSRRRRSLRLPARRRRRHRQPPDRRPAHGDGVARLRCAEPRPLARAHAALGTWHTVPAGGSLA